MVQPSHDPYKCIECFQTFNPRIPISHPRSLECKHCLCTECLKEIICDLTRLKYSGIRPTTASNLTCKLCGYKTLVYSDKLDRFPVDFNKLKRLETLNLTQPGCPHGYLEKFCSICIMNFCSPCMITHNQMHQANAMENKLEVLYRKLNHDSQDLRLETFTGKKRIGEHYQRLMQNLESEYHSTLDTFNHRSSSIENRLRHHSTTILTEKDRLNQQMRIPNGRNPSALARSISDSDSLIDRLHRQSNRAELDILKSITSGFENLTLHKKSQTNPLPSIFSAGENYSNTAELFNTLSELNFHNPGESVYDQRPSTVDSEPQIIPINPHVNMQYLQQGQPTLLPAISSSRQAASQKSPSPNEAYLYARTLTPQHLSPLHRPSHFKNL